ncbi:ankyrin repeat domain-containing protein 1-like [Schistocerca cancellata]|uniref:ankyrin repeat domain-containing protein 1-like n=1 Tax=Schistocerca cancellata TaxID=274614 RepID=UPI002117B28C|nr:ankyrin repeat domain-containing protein 1-like [Schistocerca cancellata]
MVSNLAAAAANVQIENALGVTAAHWATLGGSASMLSLLMHLSADLDAVDYSWNTPLHVATCYARPHVVSEQLASLQLLLGACASVANSIGITPLHAAAP